MNTPQRRIACSLIALAFASTAFALTEPPVLPEQILPTRTDSITVTGAPNADSLPIIHIIPHSSWESMPPKGTEANGVRRNLGPGHEETFQSITIGVTETHPGAFDAEGRPVVSPNDKVTITLVSGELSDTRTVDEGSAFNFGEYHIQIPAIHAGRGELGGGLTVIEIATIESLPAGFADSTSAGDAHRRLRVRHEINKLTLHHSATSHVQGDDLAPKLRNMQSWGESDRKWWDIPYHYMVDVDGTVYQARDHRFVGDTNTRYDPRGHFLINCFGNYSQVEPNDAQLATIANLMAWAAIEYQIEPLEIYGHRDLAQTSCPGDNLYRYLQDSSLQRMVEEVMAKGQPRLVWLE